MAGRASKREDVVLDEFDGRRPGPCRIQRPWEVDWQLVFSGKNATGYGQLRHNVAAIEHPRFEDSSPAYSLHSQERSVWGV